MNKLFIVILNITIFFNANIKAQGVNLVKDSSSQNQERKLLSKIWEANGMVKFRKGVEVAKTKFFSNFTKTELSLMAGMNFAKQNISSANFNGPFNYPLTSTQKDVYKPAFMGGVRVDGLYKAKFPFAFTTSLNKFSTGTNYKEVKTLEPFIGNFSNFKADDQMFTLNFTALYKLMIPIKMDTSKYKFYFVTGPSLDIRLSNQSLDNQVGNYYRKMFLRAHLGLEFDNNSYYTLFFHYKQGLHSITSTPIKTGFNNFDLGMMIKASDLF